MQTSPQNISIKQHKSLITKNIIDKTAYLLVLLPVLPEKSRNAAAWADFPYGDQLDKRWHSCRDGNGKQPSLLTELPNRRATRVLLANVNPDSDPYSLLKQAREVMTTVLADNPASLTLIMPGCDAALQARLAEAVICAALAACHTLPSFKGQPPPPSKLKALHVYGMPTRIDGKRLLAEAEGNNLARSLTALPPNKLGPAEYLQQVRSLARTNGWQVTFLDQAALRRKKAGAFLAVAQGSEHKDAGIVHLSYTPDGRRAARRLALVGKGICFDTGGNNLKPAKYMHGMHEDMQGSAVALGTLLALTRLQVPFAIDCWLALAENHIGPRAYKQNDVISSCNGTTIEIIHTDAEGRMVLADTLALAARRKPDLIIDYATLTGTCIYALGSRYSGIFSNRPALYERLIRTGQDSGERVWPFPLSEDFDDMLESQIADIKQCSLEGEADHILAARFLQRFVADRPWLHIDLAAGNNKGGLAHIPSDITGFGVRFSTRLLLDEAPWHELA